MLHMSWCGYPWKGEGEGVGRRAKAPTTPGSHTVQTSVLVVFQAGNLPHWLSVCFREAATKVSRTGTSMLISRLVMIHSACAVYMAASRPVRIPLQRARIHYTGLPYRSGPCAVCTRYRSTLAAVGP